MRFLFEGYFELTISVAIGLLSIQKSRSFSILYCNCFTVAVGIALGLLPLYILFYYFARVDSLDDPPFKARFGSLYDSLKMNESDEHRERKVSILHPFLFVMRRLVIISTAIWLAPWPVIQLIVAFFTTMVLVVYLLWWRPFERNFDNGIEVMNEMSSLLLLYLLMTFSDWIPDVELRHAIGWLFIGIICFNLSIHIYFLTRTIVRRIYFACKKLKASNLSTQAVKKGPDTLG